MSKQRDTEADSKQFVRQTVETELHKVPYRQLVVEPETYAFRDEEDWTESALSAFENEVTAAHGVTVPLIVRQLPDARYLVLDGHLRHLTLGNLIQKKVKGFHADMPVPVSVVVSEVSERELIALGVSANVHRRQFSALGRVRAAVSLLQHGMPKPEIAAILNIGTTTLDRDLLIGTTDWIMDHVKRHNITATTASSLLEAAKKVKRVEEFRDEFEGWVAKTKERLREENRRRQARDEDLLAGSDLWPQKYLTREQVENWGEALRNNQPFGQPAFKFRALIKRDKGIQRIEVDSLSKDINELSLVDAGKLYERFADLSEELIEVIKRKKQEEGQKSDNQGSSGKGRESLRQRGFVDLADRLTEIEKAQAGSDGEPAPDFDRTHERTEQDLSGTATLPQDNDEAAS